MMTFDMWKLDRTVMLGIAKPRSPKSTPSYNKYIKGPLPLEWFTCASQISGKATNIGLALWYLKGLCNSNTIKLSHKMLRDFDVSKNTFYRLLKAMKTSGLIEFTQYPGQSPIITILELAKNS